MLNAPELCICTRSTILRSVVNISKAINNPFQVAGLRSLGLLPHATQCWHSEEEEHGPYGGLWINVGVGSSLVIMLLMKAKVMMIENFLSCWTVWPHTLLNASYVQVPTFGFTNEKDWILSLEWIIIHPMIYMANYNNTKQTRSMGRGQKLSSNWPV